MFTNHLPYNHLHRSSCLDASLIPALDSVPKPQGLSFVPAIFFRLLSLRGHRAQTPPLTPRHHPRDQRFILDVPTPVCLPYKHLHGYTKPGGYLLISADPLPPVKNTSCHDYSSSSFSPQPFSPRPLSSFCYGNLPPSFTYYHSKSFCLHTNTAYTSLHSSSRTSCIAKDGLSQNRWSRSQSPGCLKTSIGEPQTFTRSYLLPVGSIFLTIPFLFTHCKLWCSRRIAVHKIGDKPIQATLAEDQRVFPGSDYNSESGVSRRANSLGS